MLNRPQCHRVVRVVGLASAILLVGSLVGCTGDANNEQIRHDLSPELISANQRPVDLGNRTSFTWATDNRFFWNDMSRAWMTDRPSRLEPFPVPR
ncbi:MAG: hypothetical protein JSR77_13355 [Planctomycetes bacterium]|nr:hypothetical protein [Planctomycetota bacterium]